jgi:hypothetical protein
VGPIEELLLDRVVNTMWRLRRWNGRGPHSLIGGSGNFKVSQLADQVRFHEVVIADFSFPTEITDKGAHAEATEALARAEQERDRDAVLLGRALDSDAKESDALGKLVRYERSLERSLFRTLDEFRQLQDRRRNRSSPLVLDAVALAAGDTEERDPEAHNGAQRLLVPRFYCRR